MIVNHFLINHFACIDEMFLTGAEVGLEETFYQDSEGVGLIELCVIVYTPSIECPIEFPFDTGLSTIDETAGKYLKLC